RPVEPRRSRANRLSVISARLRPCRLSNSKPASSKARFLLVASTLTSTCVAGKMADSRFMGASRTTNYADLVMFDQVGGTKKPLDHSSGLLHCNTVLGRPAPHREQFHGSHQAFSRFVVVVLRFVLVAQDLAVQFVSKVID